MLELRDKEAVVRTLEADNERLEESVLKLISQVCVHVCFVCVLGLLIGFQCVFTRKLHYSPLRNFECFCS